MTPPADYPQSVDPNLGTISLGQTLEFDMPGHAKRTLTARRSMLAKMQLMFRPNPLYIDQPDHPDAVEQKARWIFSDDGGKTWITYDRALERNWLT